MLTSAATIQSAIQVPVVPSSITGRTTTASLGRDDGFFDDDRDPEIGARDGDPDDGNDGGFVESAGGGPDASSVSLVGSVITAGGDEIGGTDAPIAGIVTANASVPAGDVAKALGDSEITSSGRARACMSAAASADADG